MYLVEEPEYDRLWHEKMATEAVADMLVDYLYTIDEDLSHVMGIY